MATPLIVMVSSYCKQKPENKAKLATALGYKTPLTVSTWIKKKKIPGFRSADITSALKRLKG